VRANDDRGRDDRSGDAQERPWRRDDSERGGRSHGDGPDSTIDAGVEAQGPDEAVARDIDLPDDIDPRELDNQVRQELRSLHREVADSVAKRLVASGHLLDEDPEVALAHALVARRKASRLASVREAVGIAAYHAGEWAMAITELRTYHRIAGKQSHLAVIADCERALGRPEKAVDMYRGATPGALAPDEAVELLMVAAGARGDMGQVEAAVAMLQVPELENDELPWVARLRYAYAAALLAAGRRDEARTWFARSAEADTDLVTDAAERLLDLDGVVLDDEVDDDDESEAASAGTAVDGTGGAAAAGGAVEDGTDADDDDGDGSVDARGDDSEDEDGSDDGADLADGGDDEWDDADPDDEDDDEDDDPDDDEGPDAEYDDEDDSDDDSDEDDSDEDDGLDGDEDLDEDDAGPDAEYDDEDDDDDDDDDDQDDEDPDDDGDLDVEPSGADAVDGRVRVADTDGDAADDVEQGDGGDRGVGSRGVGQVVRADVADVGDGPSGSLAVRFTAGDEDRS
jgi:tetratricopeptide (TPR) repeat protein